MSRIIMKLDAISGTIEIEADAEDFEKAAKRAAKLLEKLKPQSNPASPSIKNNVQSTATKKDGVATKASATGTSTTDIKPKKTTKRKGSGQKNHKMVDDLLSELQRKELRKFFEEKDPKSQADIIAVLCVKLEDLTGKQRFTQDEVYTAIQAVDQKTPASLTAAFNNMNVRQHFGSIEDSCFVPNFKCKDHVKLKLPAPGKKDA